MLLEASSLRRWRRQAIRGFRRGLEEYGVPPVAAEELAAAYPDFSIGDAVGRRRPREIGNGV